jgi:5,10-methylenetetrahydromethanopterin reductase
MTDTRWGVWLHAVRPVAELADFAAAAEALGAAAILVADEGTDRDLFVTLTALAYRTRRVLLFGAVTNPHSRHPVTTAAAFASLAEVAPGRIVAGFGAGGSRVFGPLGLRPPRPFSALVQCLDVVQALWRGETVTRSGEVEVRDARLPWVAPAAALDPAGAMAAEPHDCAPAGAALGLPLAIAGRGPRVERLAAERADWILLAGRAIRAVPPLVARLREIGRAARGRPPAIAWNPVAVWTEPMREDLRAHLAYMAVDMPAADRDALGLDSATIEQLRITVNTRGPEVAAALIPESVLDHYAIVGDRAQVVARLARLRQELQPELLVFDAGDYSIAFLEQLAALALDAGAAVLHNG